MEKGSLATDFDGSGREPRPVQIEALNWIENCKSKNMVLILPTGSGKQAIARAVQRRYGGAYMTPNNLLIDQAKKQYPNVNYLIGKDHYKCCQDRGMSCVDKREIFGHMCEDCHYVDCLSKAVQGHDTFFNPLSYYYMRKREEWFFPAFVVVDEAHSIPETLKALVSDKLSKKRYRWPTYDNEAQLIRWMGDFIEKLKDMCNCVKNRDKVNHMIVMHDKLSRVYLALKDFSHEFKIYQEPDPEDATNTILVIEPIKTPVDFIKSFFGKSRVLLMSATMPDYRIKEIFGDEPYEKLELDSPIPVRQRPVVYHPPAYQMSWRTKPELIAKWVQKVLDTFPGENTIVHTTYKLSKELEAFFPNALFNTPQSKNSTLAKFKRDGGIWFASGCAEGIDLPGKYCRLNIVIKMPRADLTDLSVLKSRYLVGGFQDYEMRALIQLQQQVGRSTRAPDDYSITVIGDKSFRTSFERYKAHLSESFKEAICWDLDKDFLKQIRSEQGE